MWISDFVQRHSWTKTVQEVSPNDAETWIMSSCSKELVDALYGFGTRLVDETLFTTRQLDAKATSLLGWTVAALAFLLISSHDLIKNQQVTLGAITGVAVVLAVSGTVQAALGLKVKEWSIPSEVDWFKEKLFSDPNKLRVFYVLSMLETHQNHNRQNTIKGEHVRRSQWLLAGAAFLIGIIIVFK